MEIPNNKFTKFAAKEFGGTSVNELNHKIKKEIKSIKLNKLLGDLPAVQSAKKRLQNELQAHGDVLLNKPLKFAKDELKNELDSKAGTLLELGIEKLDKLFKKDKPSK